ncbi:odorant receptor 49b-like isoform X3 [Cylas formicarius]|uniref:odorant receptor 49b-like isoform X3 n=1 Tax=Cylas formicarius TaxID=197179 RepID=UPI002958546C|nr:odorant receptor 49b-like isoform X3 [Cylas formicarius]
MIGEKNTPFKICSDYLKDRTILKVPKFGMVAFGIWRIKLPYSLNVRTMYFLYSAFVHCYVLLLIISMILWVVHTFKQENRSDEINNKLITNSFYIVGIVVVLIKAIFCEKKSIQQTISFVEEKEKALIIAKNTEIFKTHFKQTRLYETVNALLVIFHLGLLAFMLWDNSIARSEVDRWNKIHNTSSRLPVIYELYIPKMNPAKHEMLIVFLGYFGGVLIILLSTCTLIIMGLILFIPTLEIALQIELRKPHSTDYEMKNLVRQHRQLIWFVENLNNSVKYMILLEYITISINAALSAFQILKTDSFLERFGILCYFSYFISYVFVLGYSANEVRKQSEAIAYAIYESPWYDQSQKVKTALLIMMARAQKPLLITRGPFGEMSIQSSLTVLKATYTYVTLMTQKYHIK